LSGSHVPPLPPLIHWPYLATVADDDPLY